MPNKIWLLSSRSQGSCNQNMTFCYMFWTSDPFATKFGWISCWYIIICLGVLWKDCFAVFKVRVTAKVQGILLCKVTNFVNNYNDEHLQCTAPWCEFLNFKGNQTKYMNWPENKKINADIFVCACIMWWFYQYTTKEALFWWQNVQVWVPQSAAMLVYSFFQWRAKMGWLLRYWWLLSRIGAWFTMSLMQFHSQQTGWETKWKTAVCQKTLLSRLDLAPVWG